MSNSLVFNENLFTSIGKVNVKIDKLLIHFIHMLKSSNVTEDQKQKVRDLVVEIGKEANNYYRSIDIKKITPYDLREIEKKIIDKNELLLKDIDRVIEDIVKRKEIIIDETMAFSISDIITQLSSIRIANEYAITKDKIENLLFVKRFIADIYYEQFKKVIEDEKKLDKALYEVKEKTFLEMVKNGTCTNPEYYFKTLELVKKSIALGRPIQIQTDKNENDRGVIWIKPIDSYCLLVSYSSDGLEIKYNIGRYFTAKGYEYKIIGSIAKNASEVNYSLDITTFNKQTDQLEHILGYDFLVANYEKRYMDYENERDDAYKRNEELNKNIVGKAIDDILFS